MTMLQNGLRPNLAKNRNGDFLMENGANLEFTVEELEALFKEDSAQETPPDDKVVEPQTPETSETNKPVEKVTPENLETHKIFASRLKQSTNAAVALERERLAKLAGYESYDVMIKRSEEKIMTDEGLDPEQVAPVVDKLVQKRLAEDPRMKELESLRAIKVKEFGEKELSEVTKLTGGKITSLAQLSPEVIELWKKKGSLKAAFLELKGEELILEARSEQSKGSTIHLADLGAGDSKNLDVRALTPQERKAWKIFHPNMTDEELDKKTISTKKTVNK